MAPFHYFCRDVIAASTNGLDCGPDASATAAFPLPHAAFQLHACVACALELWSVRSHQPGGCLQAGEFGRMFGRVCLLQDALAARYGLCARGA